MATFLAFVGSLGSAFFWDSFLSGASSPIQLQVLFAVQGGLSSMTRDLVPLPYSVSDSSRSASSAVSSPHSIVMLLREGIRCHSPIA